VASPGNTHIVARFPRLALGREHSYVVGINIQRFDDRLVENGPLVVWQISGKSVGRPEGRFAFLFPRAAVDSADNLRLIWAEPADAPVQQIEARKWFFQRPATIWTATYTSSAGWSVPERIHDASGRLNWTARGGSDNFGTLDVHQGVIIQPVGEAAWRDERLVRYSLEIERGTIYPSLAVDRSDVYLAFIAAASEPAVRGAEPRVHSDTNSVFFRGSYDGGRTWTPRRLVSRSGEYPAFQVSVLVGPGGEVHMLWKQTLRDGFSVIRHVLSRDKGRTWNAPDDFIPGGAFDGMRAAVDPCGTVHVVYEDWGKADRTQIACVAWTSRWTKAAHPFEKFIGMTPDVRIAASGRPLLAFVGRMGDATQMDYATYVTELVP
jgi:hypothetical protein